MAKLIEWINYNSTITTTFQNLFADETLTDVTLACEGNNTIKAHKVVLSACSDFFREILLQHPNPHPLIYLQGISYEDLKLLKQFMYQGKASVENNNLDNFADISMSFSDHRSGGPAVSVYWVSLSLSLSLPFSVRLGCVDFG